PESDEFNGNRLGLQWQWHANPQFSFGFPSGKLGFFRLNCIVRPESDGLWEVPNLLLQKFPAEEFTATTKLTFNTRTPNEEVGFVVMGEDYQYVSLRSLRDGLVVRAVQCKNARTGGKELELFSEKMEGNEIYFRVKVKKGAVCSFSYSVDGKKFKDAGPSFTAMPGRWIGAKIGYFALREGITNDAGTVDIDWFRIE
ncbi:MAG TPA: glycoside hydrolase, partial [Draconibacterium sp.]|nr:glycoside hydrolase [Draconibacterium sp.]